MVPETVVHGFGNHVQRAF